MLPLSNCVRKRSHSFQSLPVHFKWNLKWINKPNKNGKKKEIKNKKYKPKSPCYFYCALTCVYCHKPQTMVGLTSRPCLGRKLDGCVISCHHCHLLSTCCIKGSADSDSHLLVWRLHHRLKPQLGLTQATSCTRIEQREVLRTTQAVRVGEASANPTSGIYPRCVYVDLLQYNISCNL